MAWGVPTVFAGRRHDRTPFVAHFTFAESALHARGVCLSRRICSPVFSLLPGPCPRRKGRWTEVAIVILFSSQRSDVSSVAVECVSHGWSPATCTVRRGNTHMGPGGPSILRDPERCAPQDRCGFVCTADGTYRFPPSGGSGKVEASYSYLRSSSMSGMSSNFNSHLSTRLAPFL